MTQKTEERNLITFEEFTFLAAWSRLPNYGKIPFSIHDIGENKVFSLLQSLTAKGVVQSDGEKFIVCQPYKEFLKYLAAPEEMWGVQEMVKGLPALNLFMREQTMVFRISKVRKDTVDFEFVDSQNIFSYLEESGYLPEEISEEKETDRWLWSENTELILLIQKIPLKGKKDRIEKTIQVLELPQGYVLELLSGGQKQRFYYKKETLKLLMEGDVPE